MLVRICLLVLALLVVVAPGTVLVEPLETPTAAAMTADDDVELPASDVLAPTPARVEPLSHASDPGAPAPFLTSVFRPPRVRR